VLNYSHKSINKKSPGRACLGVKPEIEIRQLAEGFLCHDKI
jgi:hypothetical protein